MRLNVATVLRKIQHFKFVEVDYNYRKKFLEGIKKQFF